MKYDVAAISHFLLVAAIFWVVICRAAKMDGNTLLIVRLQHGLIAAAAAFSLLPDVTVEWRSVIISAGVLVFMLMSSHRWRFSAPIGTRRYD